MPDPSNSSNKPEASTQESIQKGKAAIDLQKEADPAPDAEKKEFGKKDAENWRNEG
jgi:hypothetical protein